MKLVKTLLLTGENNHDWKRSAPYCKNLLEESKKFEVDLTTDPSVSLTDKDKLSDYNLFFVDYNGPQWVDPAKENFINAIRNGTNVCILHASNNAFDGWVEYEEICALMWRTGAGHGKYHKFDVEVTDLDHPITKGLPLVFKDHPDELYHGLSHMHNTDYHVLATAFSSIDSGGTGQEEPMVLVKNYGDGRIFHLILGHVGGGGGMDTFENRDFQTLLLRGCEWAATGDCALN